jgi:hypothetical protein
MIIESLPDTINEIKFPKIKKIYLFICLRNSFYGKRQERDYLDLQNSTI